MSLWFDRPVLSVSPFTLRLAQGERPKGRTVGRRAYRDRVFPNVLSEAEGQAQNER